MFVYSMRATTVKLFGIVSAALVVLIVLIAVVPTYTGGTAAVGSVSYRYDNIRSEEDVAGFLSQFGWEVDRATVTSCEVTVPAEFDAVFSAYNEIQKRQGLDLSGYKKKTVMRYTYEVTNYDGYDGTVYATVLVYRKHVIGGDVCSADVSGFLHGFEK